MAPQMQQAEAVESVAIRCADGACFVHETHIDAIWDAFWAGKFIPQYPPTADTAEEFGEVADSDELEESFHIQRGFLSTTGRFLSREEALLIAKMTRKLHTKQHELTLDSADSF